MKNSADQGGCQQQRPKAEVDNTSSNISKTTATNQCKQVPDLWRPGSVKIKRYYANKR